MADLVDNDIPVPGSISSPKAPADQILCPRFSVDDLLPEQAPSTSGARRCPLSAPRELDLGLPASSEPWGFKARPAGRRGPRTLSKVDLPYRYS